MPSMVSKCSLRIFHDFSYIKFKQISTNPSVQKQRNIEGDGSGLSNINIYSYIPVAWRAGTGKKQRIKKKDDTDGSRKSTKMVNRNILILLMLGPFCQWLVYSTDLNLPWGGSCWLGVASPDNKPTCLPKSYYLSLLLFNSGSNSRLMEQLYTFPISITSTNYSPPPFTIPNHNLAQNSPLSGFPSFCRL